MSFALTAFTHRATRFFVACLIAVVLPVQGAAIAVFAAKGPAHVHQKKEASLVLEDVRRWQPAAVAQPHVQTAWGHFHASATPERHRHAVDDSSVVRSANDGADADEALGAHALSVLALIPAPAKLALPRSRNILCALPLWALQTGFTEPLDKPPQRA